MTTDYNYPRTTIIRWIDGDTVKVLIDVGFDITVKQTVRLKGINTPELKSSDATIRKAAGAAREAAMKLAPEGSTVRVQSEKGFAHEKYGRYLAIIHTAAGVNLTDELIRTGHGVPYMVGS